MIIRREFLGGFEDIDLSTPEGWEELDLATGDREYGEELHLRLLSGESEIIVNADQPEYVERYTDVTTGGPG